MLAQDDGPRQLGALPLRCLNFFCHTGWQGDGILHRCKVGRMLDDQCDIAVTQNRFRPISLEAFLLPVFAFRCFQSNDFYSKASWAGQPR